MSQPYLILYLVGTSSEPGGGGGIQWLAWNSLISILAGIEWSHFIQNGME